MRALRRFYRNTSLRSATAMGRQVPRFQEMLDLSVTKVLCSELVRNLTSMVVWLMINVIDFEANGPILQENEIWNVIIQLTCGLRAIHQANLACRFAIPNLSLVTHLSIIISTKIEASTQRKS